LNTYDSKDLKVTTTHNDGYFRQKPAIENDAFNIPVQLFKNWIEPSNSSLEYLMEIFIFESLQIGLRIPSFLCHLF